MTDTTTIDVAAPVGFRGKPRYRRVECDWLEPEEGADKLYAIVRADLPLGILRTMPYGNGATYTELWGFLAPHVSEWNALAMDAETGEYRPAPAPAEAGPDVFAFVDPVISDWLAFVIKTTYKGIVDPKASSESGTGQSPPNAPGSVSSGPAKPSRRNRET